MFAIQTSTTVHLAKYGINNDPDAKSYLLHLQSFSLDALLYLSHLQSFSLHALLYLLHLQSFSFCTL